MSYLYPDMDVMCTFVLFHMSKSVATVQHICSRYTYAWNLRVHIAGKEH